MTTNNEARAYFAECGLSYQNIKEAELLLLQAILFAEIEHSGTGMKLNYKKTVIEFGKEGLVEAYLFVDGSYYNKRECISFNRDGFIGFAGWADSNNVAPIHRAFYEWCDEIKSKKLSR